MMNLLYYIVLQLKYNTQHKLFYYQYLYIFFYFIFYDLLGNTSFSKSSGLIMSLLILC